MCKLLVSTRWAALVCLGCVAVSARADDSQQPKPAKAATKAVETAGGDERIMQVLDEPTKLDFVETPLKDVIQAISIQHKNIPIQLDLKAITDAGSTADTPVTFQLQGIPLKSALRSMLHEHELDYVLSNGALLITAAEKSSSTMRQYDVSDLIERGVSSDSLVTALTFALPRSAEGSTVSGPAGAASPASIGRGSAAPRGVAPAPGGGFAAGGATYTIPDGEVMPFQSILLVRTTDRGHDNVETFLAELRHHMSSHAAADKTSGER